MVRHRGNTDSNCGSSVGHLSCTLVTPPNVEKTGFFSHLLVGRSCLSVCSCVIKSLKDLTAICLCHIKTRRSKKKQKKKTLWRPSTVYLADKHHSQLSHFTAFYDCLSEPWENMREHETSNQGRLRLPVVTHPNDWLPAAFQSRRRSWSGDTSWCPHCLWGYSLASPLKRTSHANRKR